LRRESKMPARARAPSIARAALDDAIPPPDLAARSDDARLVISEVVTNAVKHGTNGERDNVLVVIESDDRKLRVEVEQTLAALDVHPSEPHGNAWGHGGAGLAIVEALADAWGVEAGPPGRVWFEFDARP
jgi:anti-sigma regulatory factor (Ser/Thr protein kinase)